MFVLSFNFFFFHSIPLKNGQQKKLASKKKWSAKKMTSILFHSLPAAALADEHPFWKQEKFKKFTSSPKSPKSIC